MSDKTDKKSSFSGNDVYNAIIAKVHSSTELFLRVLNYDINSHQMMKTKELNNSDFLSRPITLVFKVQTIDKHLDNSMEIPIDRLHFQMSLRVHYIIYKLRTLALEIVKEDPELSQFMNTNQTLFVKQIHYPKYFDEPQVTLVYPNNKEKKLSLAQFIGNCVKFSLPTDFYGKSITELRSLVYGTIVGKIFSDPTLFLKILLCDTNSKELRETDPQKFDAIIFHPNFLPKPMISDPKSKESQKRFDQEVAKLREGSKKLPKTFAGIHIDSLRDQTVMRVFAIIHLCKEICIPILQKNPDLKTLRDKDPKHFDEIICHPDFLPEMRFGDFDDPEKAVPLSKVFGSSSESSSSSK